MRSKDWTQHPLGPPQDWPQALKSMVRLALTTRHPIFIYWGPELYCFYNDGYRQTLRPDRHPEMFATKAIEMWPEIWEIIGPQIDYVLSGQGATWNENALVPTYRDGVLQDVYWTYSYGPIDDPEAPSGIGGVLVICTETTQQMETARRLALNEERLRFLDRLSQQVASSLDADDIMATTTHLVADHMKVSVCAYADMDEDEDHFTIRGDWAAPGSQSIVGRYSLRDFGQMAVARLSTGEPLVIHDINKDLAPHEAATFAGIGVSATICMPLVKDGRLTALMAVHHKKPHRWCEEELLLIREVTERSWAHIERVRSDAQLLRSQEQLRRANESLEAKVAERTAELMAAEEILRQSQKLETVGQLAGGLAHDFNNLLGGIMGSLDMMRTRLAQGRVQEIERFLTAAIGAARRGASLTQRMLAFSRRQTLDPKPVDVNRLVAGMEELVSRSVGPSIHVETVSAAGLWTVLVDASQLENALLNLCVNARDAMPDGGRLTIETANRWMDERAAVQRGLTPGQYVSLCVSDTGTGMSAEIVERAFDPFFTTKPTGQGTGLGLSMVYGFAGQSGGAARIYSEAGKGTMICIYLPRHAGDIAEETPLETMDVPMTDQSQTLLLVDDEPLIRMVACEQLEELGYQVLEAGDAREALKFLEADRRIDLLITDVGLPNGLNGRQLADAARALRPDMKVLFITGYAENAVLNHGHLDSGMQVLTKPFDMDSLARRVKTLTEGA